MRSIIPDDTKERCYLCGAYNPTDRHHIFYGKNREVSEADGMTVYLCHSCHMRLHDTGWCDRETKEYAQGVWQEAHPDGDFRKRYGKNYLGKNGSHRRQR